MVTERIIKADLSQERDNFYFKLNQYDNYSRKYRLVITDNGIPKPFASQKTIRLIMQAQGEATPYYDGLLSDQWEGGYPVINFTASMLSKTGIVDFKFIIYEPSSPETISTRIQHLKIQESLVAYDGIIASEEFQFLADILAQAATIPALIVDINTTKEEVEALIASVNTQMSIYQTEFEQQSQNVQELMTAVTDYMTNAENAVAAGVKLSESWAIGLTNTRPGENTNNSKYFSEQAEASADRAEQYAGNVDPKTLSQINATDIAGLLGAAGSTVDSQDLVDVISTDVKSLDESILTKVGIDYSNKNAMNHVIGMEYLIFYHNKIRNKQAVKLIFSGDSTTYGTSIVDANYKINNIARIFLENNGVSNVTSINAGHENMDTSTWISQYLATDMASNPDLYVLRWGVNDGANQTLENRLNVFLTNLRNGLTTIRNQRNADALSIILMMPNSTNDDVYHRNYEWYDEIYPHLVSIAREFQCCFIDTYHTLYDSTNVTWEDEIMGDDFTHVHPLETGNAWIASLMAEALAPTVLRNYGVTNKLSTYASKSSTDAPSTYPYGISIYRTSGGFPYDGMVTTIIGYDGICMQINGSYLSQSSEGVAIRRGMRNVGVPGSIGDNIWAPWINLLATESAKPLPTLQNSWVAYDQYSTPQYWVDSSKTVHLRGRVKSGTITQLTIISSLPAGYRPNQSGIFTVATNAGSGQIIVGTAGSIMVFSISDNTWVSLDGICFKAEQ